MGCESQDSYPRKFNLRKEEIWGQNTPSNSPGARGTKSKFGNERVHHEVSSRCVRLMSVVFVHQKFEERSYEETSHQERCARKSAWDLAKNIYNLKNSDKATFLFSWLSLGSVGAHFEETRRARNCSRSCCIVAHGEQKRIKLRRDGHNKEVQNPYSGVDGKRGSAHPRGSPCALRFEERSQDEALHQERCARRVAWDWATSVYKLKNEDKATFYSPTEIQAMPPPISASPEEREIVVDSGASMHMLRKKT